MRWIEETYLLANPDVAADVAAGKFKSGEDHFMKVGAVEGRKGGFSGWDEEGYLVLYGTFATRCAARCSVAGIRPLYGPASKGEARWRCGLASGPVS